MLTTPTNLLKLARADRHLQPRVAIHYLTEQCNLNCQYCEDFGAWRNAQKQQPLPFHQVRSILGIIRSGVDALILTGGEPFTHPEVDRILALAKTELKFRELTIITNGSLLARHESALAHLDRLVVSLDTLDPTLMTRVNGITASQALAILDNVTRFAGLQKQLGYRMCLNTVLTPETLPGAAALIDFCQQHNLLISFSPQAVNNWPRYELAVSDQYRSFIEDLPRRKRAGAPILGSDAYLRTLANFEPFDCLPTLAPRIHTNGELSYPCRPLEKAANGQGGRPVNLLDVQSWQQAWQIAYQAHGQPPRNCHSCFQQCYAEPSLMQTRPLDPLLEWLRYPALRAGHISTHAPG